MFDINSVFSFDELDIEIEAQESMADVKSATVPQLKAWLISIGYTKSELNRLIGRDITTRDIAIMAVDEGHTFRLPEYA